MSLDIPDRYIIQTLKKAIDDSNDYYNDVNEFNLKNKRMKNEQMLEGKHLQEHKLYRHQTPYVDNQIWVGIDAITSYVTAQVPSPEVYPANDTPEARVMATDLEKYMTAHSTKFELPTKMEGAVSNLLSKYVGIIKLEWQPDYCEGGEAVPVVVDPNHVIVDHNCKLDENPRFICLVCKSTVEQMINEYPKKEKELMKMFGIKRKGALNMSAEVAYRKVWFTWYKDNKPQEAVADFVEDLVLYKGKDPNWLYEGENFLDRPTKPFIFFNVHNDGSNIIDKTSAVEQANPQQDIHNKLGRQIIDNLATANGFKVMDSHAMTKDDVQNLTGDPNQVLLLKTKPGQTIRDVVEQLPPQIVSTELISQNQSTVETIHSILGTPDQFVGNDDDKTKTASQAMLIKNQASGRQDKIVRAVDKALGKYFNLLAQFFTVHYDAKHYATINGGDGNFDFIEMHKSKVETGMTVRVQSGTTLPFDKARQEAVAQNAAELELLAPYDYYKMMHMDNPQKLFDNLVKWKTDPQSLAMDVDNNASDEKAVVDFRELMAGKKPIDRDDPSPEYIEQMRKLMITGEYLRAKPKVQKAIIDFVLKASDSLALRTELDTFSAPPPPPEPPQVMATGFMPVSMPVQGAPGAAPAGPPGMPPAPGGMPPAPAGSPIQAIMQQQPLSGGPLGQPANPPVPAAPGLNPSQPNTNMANPRQITPF